VNVNQSYTLAEGNAIDSVRTICSSQLPYTWNDSVFTAAGTKTTTLHTALGCDSVVNMTVIVNPSYNLTVNEAINRSQLPYTWRDTVFGTETTTGTHTFMFYRTTTLGCDSTVTLNLTVDAGPITLTCPSGADTTKVYDGTALHPTASAVGMLITDIIKIEYSSNGGASWSTEEPGITYVSQSPLNVMVRATNPNYDTVTCDYTLTVTCFPIKITADTAEFVYNGTAQSKDGYVLNYDGNDYHVGEAGVYTFANGDVLTVDVTGSVTNVTDGDVDNVPNVVSIMHGSVDVSGNYCVTTVNGQLSIIPAPLPWVYMTCPTSGDTTKEYDGTMLRPSVTAYSTLFPSDVFDMKYSVDNKLTWSDTLPYVTHVDDGTKHVVVQAHNPNYELQECEYDMHVTCRNVTLTSGGGSKEYDGTPLTNNTVTVTSGSFVSGESFTYTMTGSQTDAGSSPNTFTYAPNTGTHAADYCISVVEGTLSVSKKNLDISINATKEYDGTPFEADYNTSGIVVTGLVDGDQLIAGEFITSDFRVGAYSLIVTRSPIAGTVSITTPFATTKGLSNYSVFIDLKLGILPRTLELTASDATKVYDGTPLTSNGYSITGGSLLSSDAITGMTHGGSQTCVGTSPHTISDAVIMKDGTTDVTDQYAITYHDGTLKVTPFTDFTCPGPESVTLPFSVCEVDYTPVGTPTVGTGMASGSYTITSDLTPPLSAGTHIITWTLKDMCGNEMASCTQTVEVNYPPCPDAVDYEGNTYHGVRIDCECWTQRNLESKKYSDGSNIPGVYEYTSNAYPNTALNVARFGRLYDWQSAIKDGTVNTHGHVQGICPAGWYLPTAEQYASLNAHGAYALKSNLYWLDGGGDNSTGFTSLPGGYYHGAIMRYENLMGEAYYWSTTLVTGGSSTYVNAVGTYFPLNCDYVTQREEYTHSGLGYSVRCIKEKE